MSYEFNRLADVESLPEVPEGATVFAEVKGSVKRVPGSGLGGSGIKTAIIKSSDYDNTIAGLQPSIAIEPEDPVTYSCLNMTFEEAYETMAKGEPLEVVLMFVDEVPTVSRLLQALFVGVYEGNPTIVFLSQGVEITWTPDGINVTT